MPVQVEQCETYEQVMDRARRTREWRRQMFAPKPQPKPEPVAIPIVDYTPETEPVEVVAQPEAVVECLANQITFNPEPDEPEPPRITGRQILREVAAKHELELIALSSRGHQRPLVNARKEFCYRALSETQLSIPQIARFINRDHTVVIYSATYYAYANNLPFPRGASWSINKLKRLKGLRHD
jgi:hypothetical protein